MAKITENDIVVFLQQKIDGLKAELKKTQDVLDALAGGSSAAKPAAKSAATLPTAKAMTGTRNRKSAAGSSDDESASGSPVKKKAGRPKSVVTGLLQAPGAYDSKLKMESKVAFALAQTGAAFKEDVTRVLNDLEPEADPKKLDKDVTVKLSSLYKKGRIKATREGRKYRYSL